MMCQSIVSKLVRSVLLAMFLCGTIAKGGDLKVGEIAPDFEGKTADGKSVRLSDFKGKVVLLDFWATWCGPCRAETPNVIRAYESFHKLGFEVIGINMDKDKERMQAYMKEKNLQGYHTFSGEGWEDPIARQYGVSGIPRMIVLDKDQKIHSLNARGHKLQQALTELFGIADRIEEKAMELENVKASGDPEAFEQAAEGFSGMLIEDARFLNELAWNWVNDKKINYQAALIAAQKAQQLDPKATDILDTLAYAELRVGYYDKSVEHFTECVDRGMKESLSRLATALAYRNQAGDVDKACGIIEKSISAGLVNQYVEEAIDALKKSSSGNAAVGELNEQFQSHKIVGDLLNSNNLLEPKQAKAFQQDAAFFNGHRYKVFQVKLDWEKARIRCREMGGYLASITTPEENDFILNLAKQNSYPTSTCCWIGGKQDCSTRIWKWTTEESFELNEKLVVENRHEHYLNLRLESGLWEDYPNRGETVGGQWFVCEWSSPDSVASELNKPVKPEKTGLKEIANRILEEDIDQVKRSGLSEILETESTLPVKPNTQLDPSIKDIVEETRKDLATSKQLGNGALVYQIRSEDGQCNSARTEFHWTGRGRGGYRPGRVTKGDIKVIFDRDGQPAELRVIHPDYHEFSRPVTFKKGEVVIWDDIDLKRVSPSNSCTVKGRVLLEYGVNPVDITVSADRTSKTTTNNDGEFILSNLRSGEIRISASKPGYTGLYTTVTVKKGQTATCEINGYGIRKAKVRWAFQPDGSKNFTKDNITTGTAILQDNVLDRISFSEGFKQVRGQSDFLIYQQKDALLIRNFDVRGNGPAFIEVDTNFDELIEIPDFDYKGHTLNLKQGKVYVFRTYDGKNYAKMEVLEIID